MSGAIVAFSLGSTIVKKSGIPGPTMAFYRMILTSVLWAVVLRVTEHRFVTRAELRRALVPGVVFGLNITAFFTGVTKTSVANAEFIGALTPVILVPVGAFVLKERINLRSLWFALVSLAGLMLVLFNTPTTGAASWSGNLFILMAMLSWATYLLTSRRMRTAMKVQANANRVAMPIANSAGSYSVLPVAALDHRFGWSSVPALVAVFGNVLVAVGMGMAMLVIYQNRYASANITVESGQPLVTTGLDSFGRPPMYFSSVIMALGMPLALGSYWGLLLIIPTLILLAIRIADEERMLVDELAGYAQYRQRVRYRFLPYIW